MRERTGMQFPTLADPAVEGGEGNLQVGFKEEITGAEVNEEDEEEEAEDSGGVDVVVDAEEE